MAFLDYVAELRSIPNLPYPLAQTLINRAWKDIRDKHKWSWLLGNADIITPAAIQSGTVTFTLGSTTATADATAAAAFNAAPFVAPFPPLASPILGQGYQIRTASGSSTLLNTYGPLYSIVAWDGVNTLTLDRAFDQGNITNSPYIAYKAYYATPVSDFNRYLTVNNTTSGYSIRGKNLFYDQQKLNSYDPQRGGTGDTYVIAIYGVDSSGNMVHEWYPHPVNQALYRVYYERRGVQLSQTQDLPPNLSSDLLMARAYIHAADWAQTAIAQFPELGNTNWVQFRKAKMELWTELLIDAKRQDGEVYPRIPVFPNSASQFPMGGQFLQSHDTSGFFM